MNFDDLPPDQQAKARACKPPEDLLEMAQEEGYELSDEELNAISGGWHVCWDQKCSNYKCPEWLKEA